MPAAERILDFSQGEARLSLRLRQLVIARRDLPDVTVPMDEIAVVVLANREVSCTHGALSGLMAANASVVVCDESFLPTGLMLPLAGQFEQTRRMLAQAAASQPTKKRLWQQIVRAKIRAQGALLKLRIGDDGGLNELARSVRSGDRANVEATAAQRYWPLLFGPDFRRRAEAPDHNRLLNYGYAVLRAAVGRALCSAGLHPSLGVHHHGRNNAFCLADDLMEPYRPLIDGAAAEIVGRSGPDTPLIPAVKQELIGVMHARLGHAGERRTVFEWIWRSASSLSAVFVDEADQVFFPDELLT